MNLAQAFLLRCMTPERVCRLRVRPSLGHGGNPGDTAGVWKVIRGLLHDSFEAPMLLRALILSLNTRRTLECFVEGITEDYHWHDRGVGQGVTDPLRIG